MPRPAAEIMMKASGWLSRVPRLDFCSLGVGVLVAGTSIGRVATS